MSDVSRIGQRPSALEIEREAFRLLREAQAQPSIDRMKRAVDVWRLYEVELRNVGGRPAA